MTQEALEVESPSELIEAEAGPEPVLLTEVNPGGMPIEALMTRPKSVAIVALGGSVNDFVREMIGTGSAKEEMPYEEIWTVNRGLRAFSHDKLFVMDDFKWLEGKDPTYAAWLQKHSQPTITSTSYSEYPMALEYPLHQVLEFIQDDIFTVNTVAYALAYAMYIEVEKVYLYGADFFYPNGDKSEQGGQAVAYLLGLARGKYGMDYGIPHSSTLLYSNKARPSQQGLARIPYYGYHRKEEAEK